MKILFQLNKRSAADVTKALRILGSTKFVLQHLSFDRFGRELEEKIKSLTPRGKNRSLRRDVDPYKKTPRLWRGWKAKSEIISWGAGSRASISIAHNDADNPVVNPVLQVIEEGRKAKKVFRKEKPYAFLTRRKTSIRVGSNYLRIVNSFFQPRQRPKQPLSKTYKVAEKRIIKTITALEFAIDQIWTSGGTRIRGI
jgi:hypothetical protein